MTTIEPIRDDALGAVAAIEAVRTALPLPGETFVPVPPGQQPDRPTARRAEAVDRVEIERPEWPVQAYAKYRVDRPTGRIQITIIDARTNEVLREIPPDHMSRVAQELQAYLRVGAANRGGTSHGE